MVIAGAIKCQFVETSFQLTELIYSVSFFFLIQLYVYASGDFHAMHTFLFVLLITNFLLWMM
jgi:hypothetical protein